MVSGPEGQEPKEFTTVEDAFAELQALEEQWQFWIENKRRDFEGHHITKAYLRNCETKYARMLKEIEKERASLRKGN